MAWFRARSEYRPGDTLGPFRLHELINSGGMADLWLVSNQKEETYALRLMHRRLRFNFRARRRFTTGCEILSKIHNHDQVINYHGHGKLDGRQYVLMEYVEGANLKELLNRSDPILIEKIWNILMDMALALEHVHESGFMHLDYKPENLMLTRNGQLRLIDFDLALPIPPKPETLNSYGGTFAYMAPEQLLRQPIDHRADIFAYGVAAYELITRRRPFAGETAEEVLRRQLDRSQDFVAPRELNPSLSAAMDKIIVRALEKDPDKRYPFMGILIRDMQSAP